MAKTSALRLAIDARGAIAGATATNKAINSITGSATKASIATSSLVSAMKPLLAFAGIGSAVKSIADFERSMATLEGVVGKGNQAMTELTETARRLGATTEFTAGQAGEGLVELARAGFSAQETMLAVEDSLKLATATGMELGEASGLMANGIRQFGLEASEANHVASTFVEVANSANTTVPELGEAMKYAGTIMAQFNFDINESAVALGLLADRGIKGSMAGTNLRGAFLGLSKETEKVTGALDAMGLSYDDVNPATNELTDIAQKLNEGIAHVGDSAKATEYFVDLFGRRNASAGIILASNVEKLKENIDKNNELKDVHKENAKLIEGTLIGRFKALMSAVQDVFLEVGDSGLLGGMKALITTTTEGIRIFGGMEGAWDSAGIAGKALGVALKIVVARFQLLIGMKLITYLGTLAVSMWKTVSALRAMTLAQLSLNSAMRRNVFLFVASGALALATSLEGASEETTELQEAVDDLNNAMKEEDNSLSDMLTTLEDYEDEVEEVVEETKLFTDTLDDLKTQLAILKLTGEDYASTLLLQKQEMAVLNEEKRLGRDLTLAESMALYGQVEAIEKATESLQKMSEAERQLAEDKKQSYKREDMLNALWAETGALEESKLSYEQLIRARERENFLKQAGIEKGTAYGNMVEMELIKREQLLEMYRREQKEQKQIEKQAGRTSKILAEGFADAFTGFVTGAQSAKEAFQNMAQSIIQSLAEIYIKQQLVGFFTGGTTGGETGASRGAVIDDNGNYKRYASGGVVNRPTFFSYQGGTGVMGESGAEAIMPLKRDSKGNLGVASSGEGGSKTINVSMTVNTPDADSFRRSKRQIQNDLRQITT